MNTPLPTKTSTTKPPSVGDRVKVENTNWVKKGKTYKVVEDCHPAVGVVAKEGDKVIYVSKAYCKVVTK